MAIACQSDPAVRCHFDDPADLRSGERLGQKVVSSEIQNFCPKPVIRQPGRHDEWRHLLLVLQVGQQVPPVAICKHLVANHYPGPEAADKGQRFAAVADSMEIAIAAQNPLQGRSIAFIRADYQ